jgi:hypothetical protein
MTDETGNPQATRCWSIYALTAQTNQQWQAELAQATKGQAPWSNYMLISNQWGGKVEPPTTTVLPTSAVPALLSNTTLETYIQMDTGATNAGPGSCVDCHNFATLAVALPGAKASPKSDFSFLPGLADKLTARPVQFHRTLTKN